MTINRLTALTIAMLIAVAAPAAGQAKSPEERASEILREIDDMWRGDSSVGVISMSVQTSRYKRQMRMKGWSRGKDHSLVIIQSPLREKGTATLKTGATIYSYLPKTDRTIRLTAGMMMGSWMGSHFTNDDLVKESRLSDDYDASVIFEGERDGTNIIEFRLMPKPDAAVVWGKIEFIVRAKDNIPLVSTYYDEDMALVRTMSFADVKTMGGRLFPAILRVTPEDKPDEFTELVYEEMEFDIGLEESFFSIARLKRR